MAGKCDIIAGDMITDDNTLTDEWDKRGRSGLPMSSSLFFFTKTKKAKNPAKLPSVTQLDRDLHLHLPYQKD